MYEQWFASLLSTDLTDRKPALYIQGPDAGVATTVPANATALLKSYGIKNILPKLSNLTIPNGPYFIDPSGFHPAWRLYADPLEAFVLSTVPTDKDPLTYETLDANTDEEHTLSIAVPSRLSYTKTDSQPLAGVRVAIKDIFDLKGVKTGGSCRAYKQVYPPRNASAPVVQRLLELGAIVIGKTKSTQFADAESPTADWVDYHCPFVSPRTVACKESFWMDTELTFSRTLVQMDINHLLPRQPDLVRNCKIQILWYWFIT